MFAQVCGVLLLIITIMIVLLMLIRVAPVGMVVVDMDIPVEEQGMEALPVEVMITIVAICGGTL